MPLIKTDLCSTTFLSKGWVNWLSYLASALYKQHQTKLPFLGQHFYSIYRQTYYSPMSPIADNLGDICKCKQDLLFFTFDYRIMPAKAAYCIFLKENSDHWHPACLRREIYSACRCNETIDKHHYYACTSNRVNKVWLLSKLRFADK